ncbi:MAG: sulfurtransferase-like selenium metabolism protein YedF [Thermodesulfobacteriota bacterium]
MPNNTLDCQGLPCPQPVLRCKDFLEQNPGAEVQIIVDNQAALENLQRFLQSLGYTAADVQQKAGLIHIQAKPDSESPDTLQSAADTQTKEAPQSLEHRPGTEKQLVFITNQFLGHGDRELGSKLMQNFIATVPEMGSSLWRMILINSGVKLAVQGSPVLEDLLKLQQQGVDILVCGTCLGHFGLLEDKQVGQTTNMLDVVTSLQLADKVIQV